MQPFNGFIFNPVVQYFTQNIIRQGVQYITGGDAENCNAKNWQIYKLHTHSSLL